MKTWAEVHAASVEPPALAGLPVPDVEAPPTLSEMERRKAEVEKLGELGRSLELSSTQQLVQMAVETRPSASDREEPARSKL